MGVTGVPSVFWLLVGRSEWASERLGLMRKYMLGSLAGRREISLQPKLVSWERHVGLSVQALVMRWIDLDLGTDFSASIRYLH